MIDMLKLLKTRYGQFIVFMLALMIILIVRLLVLTVVQYDYWSLRANNAAIKNINTPAPRGEIFDRYGRVLAGNAQSFAVQFSADGMETADINRVTMELIEVLEANGDTYDDKFPILYDGTSFSYTYDKQIADWLISQGMPLDFTAKQAMESLRARYQIDKSLDKYALQSELQNTYKFYPPISVKSMEYLADLDKKRFLEKFKIEKAGSAEEAFMMLRKKYEIPANMSNEKARKLFVIRNELADLGYRKYMHATIARDVSQQTVITLKERSRDFEGVNVVSETVRYYPHGDTACHILGYLGKISENDKEKYVNELGYNPNDLIGLAGIEKAYEDRLKGRDGNKYVQANAHGQQVKVIAEQKPEKGDDHYLSIDLDLQKTAENALKETLVKLQRGGTFVGKYGNYSFRKARPNATVGALVAVEVKTGDILAMASYPTYDPNLFSKGITAEDWASVQSTNPRDPLAPAPLYNIATRSAVQPGSTFKPVTATAAMECGLDPNKKLQDKGYIRLGNRDYKCLHWTTTKSTHGYLDLPHALEVSCNYYFYDIGTGKDYAGGRSLGYHTPINIATIMKYAEQYGLGKPTGIEIPETVAPLPSAEGKLAEIKAMLRNHLNANAEVYFTKKVLKNEKKRNQIIDDIVSWTDENPTLKEVIKRMKSAGVKKNKQTELAELCKFTYYNQAKWKLDDEFIISIGQGKNQYTPLQMANYTAALGNRGLRNESHLVLGAENYGLRNRKDPTRVEVSDEAHFDSIMKGMYLVANGSRGSLRSVLGNLPVKVAAKSGTAERGGKINPPDEIAYLKAHMGRLLPGVSWETVNTEADRLEKKYPDIYTSRESALRRAIINLSSGRLTYKSLDAYKSDYDAFAWNIALAPADDPQIAVVALVFQGGTSINAAPMVREVICEYFNAEEKHIEYNISNTMNTAD